MDDQKFVAFFGFLTLVMIIYYIMLISLNDEE